MTNFSAKILNNSVSALAAQQAVIASTANNISNVNTEGYARRVVELTTRVTRGEAGSIDVGNGVQIGGVNRITDQFLERLLQDSAGEQGSTEIKNEFLDRLQSLFSLTGDRETIGSALNKFFDSINSLTADPSSIELRTIFISRANELVDVINTTYNTIAELQIEADKRLENEIGNVNTITAQIAELNGLITAREAGTGNTAGNERDQRELLIKQLSSKLDVKLVEQSDGSVNVTLSNGFPLVTGSTSRDLSVTRSPSFASGPLPPSLSGEVLSYIVYDYSGGGTAHVDLTQSISNGTIGGLLAFRGYNDAANTSAFEGSGYAVEAASRVEALARNLLTAINTEYLGPDRGDTLTMHDPSSGDLDGNEPIPFGLFTFSGASDTDTDGLPTGTDLTASGFDNFASIISVAISNPRAVAAARDASGGPPAAASYPVGDGRNMEALSGLRSTQFTLSVGSYPYTGTMENGYNELVTKVGNDKSRAEVDARVATGSLEAAQNRRDEVSAVSLDEEFANLIKHQKAYQAAARLLRVGQELLDEIVNIL